MEINSILSFIQNGALWYVLGGFIVLSYLLYSLFSWSFIKPFKYIGVCSIIVGCLLLIIRFGNKFIINALLSDINIPSSLLSSVFKPFLISGIICISVGIILIVLQNIYYKKNKLNK